MPYKRLKCIGTLVHVPHFLIESSLIGGRKKKNKRRVKREKIKEIIVPRSVVLGTLIQMKVHIDFKYTCFV